LDEPDISHAMAVAPCSMKVAEEAPVAFVKIAGRAVAACTPGFVKLVNTLVARGIHRFVIELSECVIMDSTFSGQLARLALEARGSIASGEKRFLLVNPNPQVIEVLDNIFVLDLFDIVHDSSLMAPLDAARPADLTPASKREVSACCLEAHRLLRTLNPANSDKFKDVVRFLEEDLAPQPDAAKA
jgi:anti-anti-sigma regulatory factor